MNPRQAGVPRRRHGTGAQRQRGAGLVSLMVAVVVSMLIMLAMMMLYRDAIHTAVAAGQDAVSDGQRASGLLAAQIDLQGAGFGLAAPALGTDLIVLSNASLDGTSGRLSGSIALPGVAGNAVVWGADTGTGYQCSGLYAPASGGLQRLPATPCPAGTQWATVTWLASGLVSDTRSVSMAAAQTTAAGCQPFGLAAAGGVVVTLAATQGSAGNALLEASVCLANFTAPSA